MPVSAEAPVEPEQGSLALLLVIDRSGSMGLRGHGVSKMAMAREAAVMAAESCSPTIARRHRLRLEQPVGRAAEHDGRKRRLDAVQQAPDRHDQGRQRRRHLPGAAARLPCHRPGRRPLKHVVLLSDGQSLGVTGSRGCEELGDRVTLSTIRHRPGHRRGPDVAVARGGLGRYYFTDREREIPRIMLRETNVVTRPVAMEGSLSRGRARPVRCCAR